MSKHVLFGTSGGAAFLSYKPELYEAKENAENLARGALGLEDLLKSLTLPHSVLP